MEFEKKMGILYGTSDSEFQKNAEYHYHSISHQWMFLAKKICIKPLRMPSYCHFNYRQVSNIRRTLVRNKLVDHSDIVGASPVGAAPTTSSWST